jgi:glycolate oxidase
VGARQEADRLRLNRNDRRYLRTIFGHQARFDETERRLYSHDIWPTPMGIRMLLKHDLPDAVVLPESEAEVVELVRFANEKGVALTPRGGGTAGNGGATPVVGGIVVDLSALAPDFDLDPETGDATVGAGMTFQELALRLAQHGRALAVEPFLPEAATLGGWFAAGGAGHGSARSGFFHETVTRARVILPDGSRRVFTGTELEVLAQACGTTGIVTALTVRTRDAALPVPFVMSYPDLKALGAALPRLRSAAPWWTFMIETPATVALKAEAVGAKVPERNSFIVTAGLLPESATEASKAAVASAVEATGGKLVDAKKAEAWWTYRNDIYRVKSLGPSLVTQSVLVPTKELARALHEMNRAVRAPHWSMTAFLAGERAMIVGTALDDDRRPLYPLAYGAALAMLAAARKVGGTPTSTGLLQSGHLQGLFSEPRLARLREFKGATDPLGIMNPGKVFTTPIKGKPISAPGPGLKEVLAPGAVALRIAHGSSWVAYQRREESRGPHKAGLSAALGAAGGGAFGRRWSWDVMVSDADLALRHAAASARAFNTLSASPYGWLQWVKAYLFQRATFTAHQVQMLHGEGVAAEAELRSSFKVPFTDLFLDLKAQLHAEGYPPLPAHARALANYESAGNRFGLPRSDRAMWAKGMEIAEKGTTLLFVDDFVAYQAPRFARRAAELLAETGSPVASLGAGEPASGAFHIVTGHLEKARPFVEATMKAVTAAGAKEVLTLDPWTHHVFLRVYPRLAAEWGLKWEVKVRHAFEVLAEKVKTKKAQVPDGLVDVALHHPPVLILHGVTEEMAQAALSLFGVRATPLLHHGRDAWDVGAAPGVGEAFPEVPERAARLVLMDAADGGAARIVSSDPASALLLAVARRVAAGTLPEVVVLGETELPALAAATREEGGAGAEEAPTAASAL